MTRLALKALLLLPSAARQLMQEPLDPSPASVQELVGHHSSQSSSFLDSLDTAQRQMVEEEMLELGLSASGRASGHALRATKRRKPVIWIHIHKAAGSLICGLAKANNEYTIEPSTNCNWINHDNCCDGGHVSCQERMDEFETQGASWSAIERVIEEEDICTEFFNYGILLRDPTELALSALNFHQYDTSAALETLHCVLGANCSMGGKDGWRGEPCGVVEGEKTWYGQPLWWWFDNIVVRTLAGEAARGLPVGAITEEHFERAVSVAQRMKVLIFLDEIANETSVLRRAFGWTELPEETPRSHVTLAESRRVHLPEDQLALARQTNHWDYALYNRFKGMPLSSRVQPLE